MRLFERPGVQRVIDRINGWIKRHSADPVTHYLPSLQQRESVRDFLDNFGAIRDELMAYKDIATPIQGDLFFGPDITRDGKWRKIYIKWYARPSKMARQLFPITTKILQRHSDIHLAMVSVLEPRGIIMPHRGPWAGSIRVHIGLQTPNSRDCYISINDQKYWWRDGEILAFDDTYDHFVVNASPYPRYILFLDVERKMDNFANQCLLKLANLYIGRLTTRE